MMAIRVENLTELAVIECRGRVTNSDSVFQLRDAVMAQAGSQTIALDLSEVQAIGGGGLGMLAFLDHWAHEHQIQFKLYNPSKSVLEGLVQNRSIAIFDIAGFHEMMGILSHSDQKYSHAA
jgi:anti-anti-sigma regulatory factor